VRRRVSGRRIASCQPKSRASPGRPIVCFAIIPGAPASKFKKVHRREPVYAARETLGNRALGLLEGDEMTWFWIGGHDEYDRLLKNL